MSEVVDRFAASLGEAAPPSGLAPALEALWWVGKGDWDRAHQVVQGHEGEADCDWVHAHLHRREGDAGNARYWYRAARKPPAEGDLEVEWAGMVEALQGSDSGPA